MRYHYLQGASKKRSYGKLKLGLGVLLILGAGSYIGFLSVLPGLGGWPFRKGTETAQRVKSVAPGTEGNRLYIPKINTSAAIAAGGVELEGGFGEGKQATLKAEQLRLELTPQATIDGSPFARLSQLSEGDEFFIDYNGTRYAYSITNSDSESAVALQTTDGSVKLSAKAIGVVAWNDGAPRIQTTN